MSQDARVELDRYPWFVRVIFGLVAVLFLVLAIALANGAEVGVGRKSNARTRPGTITDACKVIPFILAGVAFAGIRNRRYVDGARKRVVTRYGWVWDWGESTTDAAPWERIQIGPRKKLSSNNGSPIIVPVWGIGGVEPVKLAQAQDEKRMQDLAQKVAAALGIHVEDKGGA